MVRTSTAKTKRTPKPARAKFETKEQQRAAVREACLAEYQRLHGRPWPFQFRPPKGSEHEDTSGVRKLDGPEREAREAFEELRRAIRKGIAVTKAYAAEWRKPATGLAAALAGLAGARGGRTPSWEAAGWWVEWLGPVLEVPGTNALFLDRAPFGRQRESHRTTFIRMWVFSNAYSLEKAIGREPTADELRSSLSVRAAAIVSLLHGNWPSGTTPKDSVASVIAAEVRAVRRPINVEIRRYA